MNITKVKIPIGVLLFLLGAFLMFGYGQLYKHNIATDLAKLLLPIVILPNFILNIISNLGNLNWLNIVNYLRLVRISSDIDYVLFVIIGGLCFLGLAKCYMNRYEYKNKFLLFVYSILFWILIIHHTIVFLPRDIFGNSNIPFSYYPCY
jgi:hypothetical protein